MIIYLIKIFIYLMFSILIIQTIRLFIKVIRSYKIKDSYYNNTKVLNKYVNQIKSWSSEIVDENIRSEFVSYCLDYIYSAETNNLNYQLYLLKDEISKKYSNHIPSLRMEEREKKLNNLLS